MGDDTRDQGGERGAEDGEGLFVIVGFVGGCSGNDMSVV